MHDHRGLGKRKGPRVGVNYRVNIVPCTYDDGGQKAATAWLRDVAPGGVSVVAKVQLKRHEYFLLLVPRAGTTSLNVVCRVESVAEVGAAGLRLGARFVGIYDPRAALGKMVRRFRAGELAKAA